LWLRLPLDHPHAARQSRQMTEETDLSSLTFEDALKRLEQIVARLESGEAALDESITLYTQGEALRAQCEARLKDAQARIEKITLGADGAPSGMTTFDAG
jgi:exodeoxyribonuclease VII small subunit